MNPFANQSSEGKNTRLAGKPATPPAIHFDETFTLPQNNNPKALGDTIQKGVTTLNDVLTATI